MWVGKGCLVVRWQKKLNALNPLFIGKNADTVDILLKNFLRFACLSNFFYTIFVVQPATVQLVKTVATENKKVFHFERDFFPLKFFVSSGNGYTRRNYRFQKYDVSNKKLYG